MRGEDQWNRMRYRSVIHKGLCNTSARPNQRQSINTESEMTPSSTHRLFDPPHLLLYAIPILPISLPILFILLPLLLNLSASGEKEEDGMDWLRCVLEEIGIERVEVLEGELRWETEGLRPLPMGVDGSVSGYLMTGGVDLSTCSQH